jgi:glycosyltransferase involved in cell wall biosynthesis
MKICLVANPNSAHSRRFAQGLLERGHEVTLIGDHPLVGGEARASLPATLGYIDLTRLTNFRKLRYLVWGLTMPGILRRLQPDLLHALGAAGAAWLGAAAHFHPFVITATGSDLLQLTRKSTLHRRLTLWALHRAEKILCLSNQLKSTASALGVPSAKLSVTYWGIDPGIFYPAVDKIALKRQAGLAESPLVISMRAMNTIYNPLDIARAIPHILQEAPQTQFLILTYNADARILSQFQAILGDAQVSQAVHYIPALSGDQAIADLLRACDIAISMAASDGTPVSVLESMACGNALVLGDIPTLHDWVTHEQNGLFVPPGDILALSQAVVRLIRDADLRQRLGESAALFAFENAGQARSFDQVERLYQEMTSP